jgi:hypothetical protein
MGRPGLEPVALRYQHPLRLIIRNLHIGKQLVGARRNAFSFVWLRFGCVRIADREKS